ncbi:response regulator [Flavobacterium sp.]|uniref:response regulator n=1 Tax=Flavobacterium sp. TaxID=239 RepID=UPI0037531449
MPLKILLVDDHVMITDFYKMALADLEIKTKISTANSLETAYNFIFTQTKTQSIDIIILDLSMPAYSEENINSGEDLAKLIRIKYPEIKIIIVTGYCETIRLYNIRQNIYPEGILEKCDIDYDIFISAFNKIINGEIYRSETVKKNISDKLNDDIYLDNTNRQIVKLISQGIKTKNIPTYLPITLSGIKKRKLKIKQLLKIDFGSDEDIIRECKIRGFI